MSSDKQEAEENVSNEGAMTFWEHLDELRSRLIKTIVAFAIGATVAWFFRESLLLVVVDPFLKAWPKDVLGENPALNFPAPASLFISYVKLAAMGGALLALPVILYQAWAFVAPGLYAKEKRFAIPFVLASCLLFAGGGLFGMKLAFPAAFNYLLGFAGPVGTEGFQVKPTVMIGDYIEFVIRMLLAFGIVFELPVLVFFLSVAGVINHKHMIKFARYFVVVAFIIGAIVTPPDPASQLLLAIPLCILYCLSIGIAYLFGKRDLTPS